MRNRIGRKQALLGFAAVLLGACVAPAPPRALAPNDCASLLAAVDARVARARVGDAEAARIPGFPTLRVDRWLASLGNRLRTRKAFEEWVQALRELDRAARRAEIANLPPAVRAELAVPGDSGLEARVESCAAQRTTELLAENADREALVAAARVPDEYRTSWRVLGVYPASSLLVAHGVAEFQATTRASFSSPSRGTGGQLLRYRFKDSENDIEPGDELARAPRNALGVPRLAPPALDQLYARHAPVLEIEVASGADRIGTPRWNGGPWPEIDTSAPVAYRRLSYAHDGPEVLLQLNYVYWIPARPVSGALDLLSGRLDGLNWRVTLDADGRPILYDVMHNCGCYHMYFPTTALQPRGTARLAHLEPPLIPKGAPTLARRERMVLRLAAGTHYVKDVYAARAEAHDTGDVAYRLEDYDALRSLPASEGRQSLFGPDGIVPGTERGERWVLWPMGVPAPGAMRQWGHHAVAFIGRRHFDDPDLIERLFVRVGEPS